MGKRRNIQTVLDEMSEPAQDRLYSKKRARRNLSIATEFFREKKDLQILSRLGENDYHHCNICGRPPKPDRLVRCFIYLWDRGQYGGGQTLLVCERCHIKIQDALHKSEHDVAKAELQVGIEEFKSRIGRRNSGSTT